MGYEVLVSDVDRPFGAVRQVSPHGRPSWSFIGAKQAAASRPSWWSLRRKSPAQTAVAG